MQKDFGDSSLKEFSEEKQTGPAGQAAREMVIPVVNPAQLAAGRLLA